jgi:hypothetical protein
MTQNMTPATLADEEETRNGPPDEEQMALLAEMNPMPGAVAYWLLENATLRMEIETAYEDGMDAVADCDDWKYHFSIRVEHDGQDSVLVYQDRVGGNSYETQWELCRPDLFELVDQAIQERMAEMIEVQEWFAAGCPSGDEEDEEGDEDEE